MPGSAGRNDAEILDIFANRLKTEWRRQVACQCQSSPCTCERSVVCVDKMVEWMKQDVASNYPTNIDLVLDALHPKFEHRTWYVIKKETILRDDDKRAEIYDNTLKFHIPTQVAKLRKELENQGILNAARIIDDFKREKWKFCSPTLDLNMNESFEGGKFMLPFCKLKRVNLKGGTAKVFLVAVQKGFVTDKLANVLKESSFNDKEFRECYRLAVKSFPEETKDIYETEKKAFSGLPSDKSIPIIRYLGCYTHEVSEISEPEQFRESGEGRTSVKTYNLLLEFGNQDLDEYWEDPDHMPPVQSGEIIRYYKSMANIAHAMKFVHEVKLERGQNVKVFNGWHADIKPDNILRVHGEFKLADFGFAKFVGRADKDETLPEQYIEGGTDTYGAPEVASAKHTKVPVRQTIDTWSFGCVLSAAATWVVLGYQGIQQFSDLRIHASQSRSSEGLQVTDRFHDGFDVFPEIEHWHNYLRQHLRASDTATGKILDLIEHKMLKRNPDDRIISELLCEELEYLLADAERRFEGCISNGRMKEPHQAVQSALAEYERKANRLQSLAPSTLESDKDQIQHSLRVKLNPSIAASKRVGKQDKMKRAPIAKTSYRQEMFQERWSESFPPSSPPAFKDPIQPERESPDFFTQPKEQKMPPAIVVDNLDTDRIAPTKGDGGIEIVSDAEIPGRSQKLAVPDRFTKRTEVAESSEGSLVDDCSSTTSTRDEPTDVYELPYDVCKVRQEIVNGQPQSTLRKIQSRIAKPKIDKHLRQFISDRDIILVIDNGSSMREYWPIVTFVAETLEKKLKGLDQNGIDIRFAFMDHENKVERLKSSKQLRRALDAAQPNDPISPEDELRTDMNHVLQVLFSEHRKTKFQKETTLLVLTDGLWKGTVPASGVEDKIVEFAKELAQMKLHDRHFTIGFIRFGLENKQKLKALDDGIAPKYHVRDMVDEISWKSNVNNMILGSFIPSKDAAEVNEEVLEGPDMPGSSKSPFGPEKLLQLFHAYNRPESSSFSPSIRRSHSRSGSTTGTIGSSMGETKRRSFFG